MLAHIIFVLLLGLTVSQAVEEGSGLSDSGEGSNLPPPPLPECYLRDVPEFIDTLKKHIKSVNKAGELDCSNQGGFVGEICKYGDEWADGDTDIIIKWNDCGKISFLCSVYNRDADYAPRLPAEVTNLGLNGDCPADNTLLYAILGGVCGLVVLILAVIVGCRFKKK